MSIFPTKILLATDGSREAQLAARTAADLSPEDQLRVARRLRLRHRSRRTPGLSRSHRPPE